MPILNKYGVKGGGAGVGKNTRCEGGGGSAKKSFKFCSDGICINANKNPPECQSQLFEPSESSDYPWAACPRTTCFIMYPSSQFLWATRRGGTQKILSN